MFALGSTNTGLDAVATRKCRSHRARFSYNPSVVVAMVDVLAPNDTPTTSTVGKIGAQQIVRALQRDIKTPPEDLRKHKPELTYVFIVSHSRVVDTISE